jgi:hypothetical protein
MPQITIRVSELVLKQLQALAAESNLSVTDYMLSKSLPGHLDDVLTTNKVLQKVHNLSNGTVFNLPELFADAEWNNFKPGSRIATGRSFFKAVKDDEHGLSKDVAFLRKNSANLALYKKLT